MEVQLAAALDVEFAAAAETFKDNGGGGRRKSCMSADFHCPLFFSSERTSDGIALRPLMGLL